MNPHTHYIATPTTLLRLYLLSRIKKGTMMSFREDLYPTSSSITRNPHSSILFREFITPPRAPRFNTFAFEAYAVPEAVPFSDYDSFEYDEEPATMPTTPPPAPQPNTFAFEQSPFGQVLSQSQPQPSSLPSSPSSHIPSTPLHPSTHLPSEDLSFSLDNSEVDMSSLIADTDTSSIFNESFSLPSTPPVLVASNAHIGIHGRGTGLRASLGLGLGFGRSFFRSERSSGHAQREDVAEDDMGDDSAIPDARVCEIKIRARCTELGKDSGIRTVKATFSPESTTLVGAPHTPPSGSSRRKARSARASSLRAGTCLATPESPPRKLTRNLSVATISSSLKRVQRKSDANAKVSLGTRWEERW